MARIHLRASRATLRLSSPPGRLAYRVRSWSAPLGSLWHLIARFTARTRAKLRPRRRIAAQSATRISTHTEARRTRGLAAATAVRSHLSSPPLRRSRGLTARTAARALSTARMEVIRDPSPLDIPDLSLWLDASDEATLYDATTGGNPVAPDGLVARWEDKSGKEKHLTQSAAASRATRRWDPELQKYVMRLDGANRFYAVPSYNIRTAFILVRRIGPQNQNAGIFTAHPNPPTPPGYISGGGINQHRFGGDSNTFFRWSNNSWGWRPIDTAWHRQPLSAAFGPQTINPSATNGNFRDLWNIVSIEGVNANHNLLFRADNNPDRCLNGDVAEIVVFSRHLNADERDSVFDYLWRKWSP